MTRLKLSSDYRIDGDGWVNKETPISEELLNLLKWFVLQSPAFGESKLGIDLISEAGIERSSKAEALYNKLTDNVRCEPKGNSEEVGKELSKMLLDKGFPKEEIAVFTIVEPQNYSGVLNLLSERETDVGSSPAEEDEKKLIKNKYYKLDSLFRHLRNALSHGCLKEITIDGRRAFLFHDVMTKEPHRVTAVMAFTYERLHGWYTEINRCINV